MNLLVVDDEVITREGIVQTLPWSELGIHQIQQSDDGINALRTAQNFKPDIILTDVRMPRMDGIQLSYKLKELYPYCAIIFMSGYSDKEYFKAAIRLEAVDYVDKPIIISELKSAIEKAIARLKSAQILEHTKHEAEAYVKLGIPLLRSKLAISLLDKYLNPYLIIEQAKTACIELPIDGFYITVIVRFYINGSKTAEHISSMKEVATTTFENTCHKHKINVISAFKDDQRLILHLFTPAYKKHLLTHDKLLELLKIVTVSLENLFTFVISVGKPIHGLANIKDSCASAISALERAFFRDNNSILFHENNSTLSYALDSTMIKNFTELINKERRETALFFIKNLVSILRHHENTPVNNIKDFFYTILLELYNIAHQKGVDLFQPNITKNHIWEMFLKLNTLSDIEELLMEKLNYYFETSKQKYKNSNLIDKIYKYVELHYTDPDLSINKISEQVHFAPTYICSIFKLKTNKTLNQYITEYRIDKSKEYLKDPDIKVSDIASKVGCRDSGYFTKLFKKTVGTTPTEYRERIIP
jgi:two-component system, response regulator YesN